MQTIHTAAPAGSFTTVLQAAVFSAVSGVFRFGFVLSVGALVLVAGSALAIVMIATDFFTRVGAGQGHRPL